MRTPLSTLDVITRSTPGTGLAFIVGFFFSFRLILSFTVVRVFGASPQTGSALRLALGFLLVATAWLWLLDSPHRSLTTLTRLPSMPWVCAFLLLSLSSLLWTEAASPAASFLYWAGTASDVLVVALFLRASNPLVFARALLRGFIAATCSIALIAWILPAQYDLRLGEDTLFNPNSIGNLCALAIFFSQYLTHCDPVRRIPHRRSALPTIFLALTLLRSLSKTTIIAFVVAETFILLRDRSMTRRRKLLILSSVVMALVLFSTLLTAYFDFYTSYGNESVTLTGRTAIWAWVGQHSLEKPWLGHGFDSMWNVVPAFGTFEARHAENELLEQFYSYGLAGLIILAGLYRSLFVTIRRHSRGPDRIILIATLIYVVIRGAAEADPFDLLLPLWFATLLPTLATAQIVIPLSNLPTKIALARRPQPE